MLPFSNFELKALKNLTFQNLFSIKVIFVLRTLRNVEGIV